ncbi:MAG TPA: hypothetical protein VFU37_01170, partial [Pyrinomonadaceae bacterium]|nr:hypothetical protein [Pyrinomonadaceae bacterium]
NAEEIKLGSQRISSGDATVVINIELPLGYHLNPTAPQHYQLSIDPTGKVLAVNSDDASRSLKGSELPVRVSVRAPNAGSTDLRASFTFVYCREDNTGVCRIKTLQWLAPVEVVAGGDAGHEIKLSAKVD